MFAHAFQPSCPVMVLHRHAVYYLTSCKVVSMSARYPAVSCCVLAAEDRAHVEQCLAVVTDAVAEGRLAFHPVDFYKTHKDQVEQSKPYIVQYGNERLPKYMQASTPWDVKIT